jgi:hypothetical protein
LQIDRPSIRSNLEFGSNVTFSREWQDWKQRKPRIWTENGMQIHFSNEDLRKASDSSTLRLENRSNVILTRELHDLKQCRHRISAEDGMQIDASAQQS